MVTVLKYEDGGVAEIQLPTFSVEEICKRFNFIPTTELLQSHDHRTRVSVIHSQQAQLCIVTLIQQNDNSIRIYGHLNEFQPDATFTPISV